MEKIFKLPISILNEKDYSFITHHYHYYTGNKLVKYSCYEYEIFISHIRVNGEHYLHVSINDNINKKNKNFKIHSITESSLKKLQERLDDYINKLGITTKFINSWQELIDAEIIKQYTTSCSVLKPEELNGDLILSDECKRLNTLGNCTGLTKLYLPDSTTYIDSNAIAGCTSLTDISFSSVTNIQNLASTSCGSIKVIPYLLFAVYT